MLLARRGVALQIVVLLALAVNACKRSSAVSVERAQADVIPLVQAAERDVAEVQKGLPQGAELLSSFFAADAAAQADPQTARNALERARSKVADLRIAKSTFFALATQAGAVIRTDQEQDAWAGKNLFEAFPALKEAAQPGKYVESQGTTPELAGVRGRADAQWIVATPVKVGAEVRGLYVTGWSWSAYAYRLENAVRSKVRSELVQAQKLPLLYVYVLVGKQAFGAPISPDINSQAILEHAPLTAVPATDVLTREFEITGRSFGVAVKRCPALGADVAIAILRSET